MYDKIVKPTKKARCTIIKIVQLYNQLVFIDFLDLLNNKLRAFGIHEFKTQEKLSDFGEK